MPCPPSDPAAVCADSAIEIDSGCVLLTQFSMRHAGPENVSIGYELVGNKQAPVVLVAGGISAHKHLASNAVSAEKGWVEDLIGPTRTLNPYRFRLLGFDFVGADGKHNVPIDTSDQADAVACLLHTLNIQCLYAYVGYSYGALVGLQLAARHRPCLQRLVVVSGAHRPHPYASAWRALQRRAVALGQMQGEEKRGLALARQFAMLSYRTPEEFGERFDAPAQLINDQVRVAAEDYLDVMGQRYVARTPVHAYLRLSESIDLHRVDPTHIRVPTVVVAVEGDRLVPLADMVHLVEGLGKYGRLRVLRSPYGHDAFLKETDRIDAILNHALLHTAPAPLGESP